MKVDIEPGELAQLEVIRAGVTPAMSVERSGGCFCRFHMDEKARVVRCHVCGRVWEAFDALMFMANHWTRYEMNRVALKGECEALIAKRDRLRRDVQNAKAQLRTVTAGAAKRVIARASAKGGVTP